MIRLVRYLQELLMKILVGEIYEVDAREFAERVRQQRNLVVNKVNGLRVVLVNPDKSIHGVVHPVCSTLHDVIANDVPERFRYNLDKHFFQVVHEDNFPKTRESRDNWILVDEEVVDGN